MFSTCRDYRSTRGDQIIMDTHAPHVFPITTKQPGVPYGNRRIPRVSDKRVHALIIGSLCLFLGVLSNVSATSAESNATLVVMRYVTGISNWGPMSATGISKVWRTDGEVMLTVDGLPHLPAWQEYRLWLTNKTTGALVPVGRFNTDTTGHGGLDTLLYNVVSPTYNLLIITVQSVRDPHNQPGARRTLAGYIPGNSQLGPPPTAIPVKVVTAPQTQTGQTTTAATTTSVTQPTAVGQSAGSASFPNNVAMPTSAPTPPLPTSLPQTGLARPQATEVSETSVGLWSSWTWAAVICSVFGLTELWRVLRRHMDRRF